MQNVDEIKQKIDIVDLIGGYVPLKKAGRSFRGNCPFHQEKTPSFMVTPEKQIWYCFGCNQGGDIFTFVQKIEGVDFSDSLKMLADKAGVILNLGSQNIEELQKSKSKKLRTLEILSLLEKFYHYFLNTSETGKAAKEYLTSQRGIPEEIINAFSIGLAPVAATTVGFLNKRGYLSSAEIESTGLFSHNRSGGWYDKMQGRIIFPIRNVQNQVIGFGGRLYAAQESTVSNAPKYLNSAQSDVYDKSSALFGIDLAKASIREKDCVIVVEGYMDVVASHIAGVKNVVATCGTALTKEQIVLLSRYTKNIIFCFDADTAGMRALERVFEVASGIDVTLQAVDLLDAKDPDELVSSDPTKWLGAVEAAIPAVTHYYNFLKKQHTGGDAAAKKLIAEHILPIIAQLASDIERAHYLALIASDMGIAEKFLHDALRKIKEKQHTPPLAEKQPEGQSADNGAITISRELLLLGILLSDKKYRTEILTLLEEADFSDQKIKSIYKTIVDCHNTAISGGKDDSQLVEDVKKRVDHEATQTLDVLLLLTSTFFEDMNDQQRDGDISLLIRLFAAQKNEKQRAIIQQQLFLLDKSADREKVKELLKQLQSLI